MRKFVSLANGSKVWPRPAACARAVERGGEVDRGLGDRPRSQRAAQEVHVRALVRRDLGGVLGDGGVHEGNLAPARDRALRARSIDFGGRQPLPRDGAKVELGFQVFEVEGEVEDVGVGDGGCLSLGQRRVGAAADRGERRQAGLEDEAPRLDLAGLGLCAHDRSVSVLKHIRPPAGQNGRPEPRPQSGRCTPPTANATTYGKFASNLG